MTKPLPESMSVRAGGDSESSRGAAIPEEHVRQPSTAETWTPAETLKRGETVVQEASPGASVGVYRTPDLCPDLFAWDLWMTRKSAFLLVSEWKADSRGRRCWQES